ncbi:hypothetical protein JX266_014019 [Neoarthrinium moseri]|nr:hypothetical protein JX266_014019 [Neoarthrinium moseri]
MGIGNIGRARSVHVPDGFGSGILPQTQSTRSDSHPDIMQWTAELQPHIDWQAQVLLADHNERTNRLRLQVLEPPNTWANENVQSTSGNHFFEETLRLFYPETIHHTLTAIQALGIMSLRDATADGTRKFGITLARVRTAIGMGLHQLCDDGDEDEIATQVATFCASPSTMRCSFLATNSSDALVYRSVLGHATRRGAGLAG